MSSEVPMETDSISTSSALAPPRGYYLVHARSPTIITACVVCHFTAPGAVNLVLARVDRLDLWAVTPTGIEPIREIPLYGRIATLNVQRMGANQSDRLLITTDTKKFFCLSYDSTTQVINTVSACDLHHKVARGLSGSQQLLINPQQTCIAMQLYDGLLTVVGTNDRGMIGSDAFDLKLSELNIIAIAFLSGYSKPTFAVLHEDTKKFRHLRTYAIDMKEKDLKDGPISVSSIPHRPSHLIPVTGSTGGLIVITEESVTYYESRAVTASTPLLRPATITAWTSIDDTRYLVGDLHGDIHLIKLTVENNKVTSIKVQRLGSTTIAHAMTYIDSGFVFIGSTLSDHALIQLQQTPDENGDYLRVIDNYPNLGAIVDMAVHDRDEQTGQAQLVTCSNAFQFGSLRVVRNGIGIHEEASVELPGIQALFGVKSQSDSEFEQYLVQSFIGETRVLAMNDDELGEIEIDGLDAEAATIWAANLTGTTMIQITERCVRLIDTQTLQLLQEWKPDNQSHITHGSSNGTAVLVACGRMLVYFTVNGQQLIEAQRRTLDFEVACVDLTSVQTNQSASFAVVGMWSDLTVRVVSLPSLEEVSRATCGGEVIPRSVLIAPFSPDTVFVICGLGDGHLIHWRMDPRSGTMSSSKKIVLGSQPVILSPFKVENQLHVFASCDRPTVAYTSHSRLLFSNVTLKSSHAMCSFHTATFPSSLAFAVDNSLVIGPMDSIQKLHIVSIALKAQPRNIQWMKDDGVFVVTMDSMVIDESRRVKEGVTWREQSNIQSFDDSTFESESKYDFDENETASAMCLAHLLGQSLLIVGTTFVMNNEAIPKRGRLHVFRVEQKRLVHVSSTEVLGAVYSLDVLIKHQRVIAGVNNKVIAYSLTTSSDHIPTLKHECSSLGGTVSLTLNTFDSYIAVGDLQQGLSYLRYNAPASTSVAALQRVARDSSGLWVTAVAPVTSSDSVAPVLLVADHNNNLSTMTRSNDSAEDRNKLMVTGRYHLGDFVNVIKRGSLVSTFTDNNQSINQSNDQSNDQSTPVIATHLLGTISGAVLVLAPLSRSQFSWFARLEEQLEKLIGGVGGLSHREWRSFNQSSNQSSSQALTNIVDGDLIEMTNDLSADLQRQLAMNMNESWESISQRVEEVSRLH